MRNNVDVLFLIHIFIPYSKTGIKLPLKFISELIAYGIYINSEVPTHTPLFLEEWSVIDRGTYHF